MSIKKATLTLLMATAAAAQFVPAAAAQTMTSQQTTTEAPAEETSAAGESDAAGGTCPAMQIVAVQGKTDSKGSTGGQATSGGVLGEIVTPVLAAANEPGADASGGFATSTSAAATTPQNSGSGVLGGGGSKDTSGWVGPASSTPAEPSEEQTTAASESATASQATGGSNTAHSGGVLAGSTFAQSAPQSSTAAAGVGGTSAAASEDASAEQSAETTTNSDGVVITKKAPQANVGRTFIAFNSGEATPFIPGVHSEPDNGDNDGYAAHIDSAAEETMSVLNEIHTACPDTKVALIGHAEGAQVAGQVARQIGSGEAEFPSDHLTGVSLLADPSRGAGQPTVAEGAEIDGLDTDGAATPKGQGVATVQSAGQGGADGTAENNAGYAAATPGGDYGEVSDRVASFCLDGDATCALEADSPLGRLVAGSQSRVDASDPQGSLDYIGGVLAPAVTLGSVEGLAEDLEFGEDGFTFRRASTPESTTLGRIASEADKPVEQSERERRLVAAGAKLGGMGLAAGITVAKKAITPENIAAVAAAGAINPGAGVGVAALKLAEAATNSDVITERTLSTGTIRLLDEAKGAGLDDDDIDSAAVASAISSSTGVGAYRSTPVNSKGETATTATTGWLMKQAASAAGDKAPESLTASETEESAPVDWDSNTATTAMEELA